MKKRKVSLSSAIVMLVAGCLIGALVTAGIFSQAFISENGQLLYSGLSIKQIKIINEAASIINRYSIEEQDNEHTLDYALKGMAASLDDDYAYYFTPEELKEYNDSSSGTVQGGIGAGVQDVNGDITITDIYKSLTADAAGLKAGDIIRAVNDESVKGKSLSETVALVKGETGTSVKITVERDGKELAFNVMRGDGQRQMTEYRMIGKVLYIKINSFHGNVVEYFNKAIDFGVENMYEGIVIDLRENPGGELNLFAEIADKMLPEGETFYALDRYGNRTSVCRSDAGYIDKPVSVIINASSASASEALAGALRDMGNAKTVGVKSFGKGIMQTSIPLSNGGMFKLTTAKYYLPGGDCIHKKGIEPEYKVELSEELTQKYWLRNDENDLQLKKAIEVLTEK